MDLNDLIKNDEGFYKAMEGDTDAFTEPFRQEVKDRIDFLREVQAAMWSAADELEYDGNIFARGPDNPNLEKANKLRKLAGKVEGEIK